MQQHQPLANRIRASRLCRETLLMRAGLAIQTKSAYADSEKIKGLKPAKAGFVCVAATYSRTRAKSKFNQ